MAQNSEKTAILRRRVGRPFRPGQSGNPGGRPKEAIHVRDLARQRTEEAIQILTAIMQRGKAEQARVRAAEGLLDRGWGRPVQGIEHARTDLMRVIVNYTDKITR